MKILGVKKIKGYNPISEVIYRLEDIVFKIDINLEMMSKDIWGGERKHSVLLYEFELTTCSPSVFIHVIIHLYLSNLLVAHTGLPVPSPGPLLTE